MEEILQRIKNTDPKDDHALLISTSTILYGLMDEFVKLAARQNRLLELFEQQQRKINKLEMKMSEWL